MKYFLEAVMPPPMTMRPSMSWAAMAIALPATVPISAKAACAASGLPGRVPSAIS